MFSVGPPLTNIPQFWLTPAQAARHVISACPCPFTLCTVITGVLDEVPTVVRRDAASVAWGGGTNGGTCAKMRRAQLDWSAGVPMTQTFDARRQMRHGNRKLAVVAWGHGIGTPLGEGGTAEK